jgi:hypothetical protein
MSHQSVVPLVPQRASCLGETLNLLASPPGVNLGLVERLASLAVGTAIVLVIARRFFLYLSLAIAGGYLLYRGATGYCPLYANEQRGASDWRGRLSVITRSMHHEQDKYAGQMATSPGWPENEMGQAYR